MHYKRTSDDNVKTQKNGTNKRNRIQNFDKPILLTCTSRLKDTVRGPAAEAAEEVTGVTGPLLCGGVVVFELLPKVPTAGATSVILR